MVLGRTTSAETRPTFVLAVLMFVLIFSGMIIETGAIGAPLGNARRDSGQALKGVKTTSVAPNRSSNAKQPPAQTGSEKKLSGPDLYLKARQFFAAGRYAEAIQYAAAAQRRVSNSKLPTVLVAQAYYRMGNLFRAAKLFRSVGLSDLPREAAVDYLFTMFAARRYADVIKSYHLVPDNHPYRDVARFYLGSAYVQLRLYQKANAALRAARKIPPNLKTERRELLSYIKQLRQAERQGEMQAGPAYSIWGQTGYIPPPVEAEPIKPMLPGGVPGKAPPPKAPQPKSGVAFFATPGLNLGLKSTRETAGASKTQTDSQTPAVSLALGLKYLGQPKSFGGQPSFDLGFTPSYSSTDSRTTSSKLTAEDSDPSNVRNETTTSESKSQSSTNTLTAGAKYPVSDPIDLGASYKLVNDVTTKTSKSESYKTVYGATLTGDFDAIDFGAEYSLSSSGTKGDSSSKNSTSTSKLSLSHSGAEMTTALSATLSSNQKPSGGIKSATDLDLGVTRNLDDFTLELNLVKSDKVREPLSAAGKALSQTGLKAELTYSLGIGLTASGFASFTQLASLPVLNEGKVTDGPEEVLASGSMENYVVTFKFAPVSFASASLSYDYSYRDLKVGDANFRQKLQSENWSEYIVTAINVGLNYSF